MHPYYITVRVGDIKFPDWILPFCSATKLQMMKDSIAKYGLVNYPICYRDDQGVIHLIDGFARLKALGDDTLTTIQCMDMTKAEAQMFYINLSQPDFKK